MKLVVFFLLFLFKNINCNKANEWGKIAKIRGDISDRLQSWNKNVSHTTKDEVFNMFKHLDLLVTEYENKYYRDITNVLKSYSNCFTDDLHEDVNFYSKSYERMTNYLKSNKEIDTKLMSFIADINDYTFQERLRVIIKLPENCKLQQSDYIRYQRKLLKLVEIKREVLEIFSDLIGILHSERKENLRNTRDVSMWNSRIIAAVDPSNHIKGVTYEEITNFLQGYVQNEVDLNDGRECWKTCEDYKETINHGCYQNLFCSKQNTCRGKIRDCRFVDADLWVCLSNKKSRRYENILYDYKYYLGPNQGCSKPRQRADSWSRYLFWRCNYCFCICEEVGPNSDKYFSLRPVLANTDENRVVTALKFSKVNRIIHLRIQEAELLPYGKINQSSVTWVPEDSFKITDYSVVAENDFHTLTWEQRAVDLDDLYVEEGFLITGVRLKLYHGHLNFEIQATPFDFVTGKLLDSKTRSVWIDNPKSEDSYTDPRKRIKLTDRDVPTKSKFPSYIHSETNQFLEFTHTDMYRDAAQTTIPFIDIQQVEPEGDAVPLRGAGVYHKDRMNYGGFIGLKIMTYDFRDPAEPMVN